MDPQHQLLLMAAVSAFGAVASANVEAEQIHFENSHPDGRDLPHSVLTFIRLVVCSFVAFKLVGLHWRALTLIVFCAACFGPIHRTLLNFYRRKRYPDESKTIEPWHLRGVGYDNLMFFLPTEKSRFIALCSVELLLAAGIYVQASIQ